uniref:Uncharacterized protein n=1 Tax=Nelumbo nucifera TaxID=4432 RepID=A0A822XQJ9_NELNU|nr:TPA_asm: hypothetical protein HUJ06_025347 [Nelumbo nucifera]
MNGISAYPSISPPQLKLKTSCFCFPPTFSVHYQRRRYLSDNKLTSIRLTGGSSKLQVQCSNSSGRPGGSGSVRLDLADENESRSILDAFFLGKALAEVLNERIESTVGELLSAVGRLQAEQQKQVQEFQEDVIERAKRAKEKAAREAMETQGLIVKAAAETPAVSDVTPEVSSSSSESTITSTNGDPTNKDPILG